MNSAIILIDFDGTCVPALPESGYSEVDIGAEKVLKELVKEGHRLVLWTVRNRSRNNPYNYVSGRFRNETSLDEAEKWFRERNIPLYGVNEVPGEEDFVGYSRKILGDFLIDDTSIGIPLISTVIQYYSYNKEEIMTGSVRFVDWVEVRKILFNIGLLRNR